METSDRNNLIRHSRKDGPEARQPTAAKHIIRRIQLLNCQIEEFQNDLDVATHQFTVVQEILADTQRQLKVAQQALEKVAQVSSKIVLRKP